MLSVLLRRVELRLRLGLPVTEPPPARTPGSAAPQPWFRAVVGAILPWLLLLVVLRPMVTTNWPPYAWSGSLARWASGVTSDIGLFLPVLAFAAGSALVRVVGLSRRLAGIAAAVAIAVAALGYVCSAVIGPTLTYGPLAEQIPDIEEVLPFGPPTPAGLVRNLRYVEENPPAEFSLSTNQLRNRPPNALLWELHHPIAIAVFAVINLFLGVLAAEATAGMARPAQLNTRLAIGVVGAVAFRVLLEMGSPIQALLRGDPMGSAALGAWRPLALPVAEALLLGYLAWRRRR